MSAAQPVSQPAVLIVTALEGMEATASVLAAALELTVEIASTPSAALRLLDRRGYAAVVLDQLFADAEPDAADLLWKRSGLAIPLQISFGVAGAARLEREIRGALARRACEQRLAGLAAAAEVDAAVKNAVTGFLLESQLALAEEGISPQLHTHLQNLAAMAGALRERLGTTPRAAAAGAARF